MTQLFMTKRKEVKEIAESFFLDDEEREVRYD